MTSAGLVPDRIDVAAGWSGAGRRSALDVLQIRGRDLSSGGRKFLRREGAVLCLPLSWHLSAGAQL
jgi:hypothetical protein